jgi:lipoprotein-releasing system permease protein
MLRQMAGISGQLGVQGNRDGLQATPDLLAKRARSPRRADRDAGAEGQVIAVAGEKVRGVLLRGMTPEDFRARTPLAAAIDGPPGVRERYRNLCRSDDGKATNWGTLKDFGDGFTVAVGKRFADLMGLKVGDRLQIVSPVSIVHAARRDAALGDGRGHRGVLRRHVRLRFELRLRAARRGAAPAALGDKVSTIEVFLADGTPLGPAKRQVAQAVGLQGWVFDWFQANFGFFAAIQGQTNVLFIVLTMIVLVAAFNIVSSLVMLVRTKTGDIAICAPWAPRAAPS